VTGPVVDIHCHTFNGDDLPARGFIHRVKLRDVPLGGSLAQVVDLILQRGAPGFHADKARLDRLLGATELESGFELPSLAPALDAEAQLAREVEDTLADLQARNPELLHRAELELTAADRGPAGEIGPEGLFDVWGTIRRAVTWATLFTKSRLDLAALLVRNFHDEVDLFCPLLVDMGASLGDVAQTTAH
jgi:hypothetical protein